MYKAGRNRPLKPWQEWFNKAVSGVRSGVERIFGKGKTGYGLGKTCYFGEARVHADNLTFAIAYNLRRAKDVEKAANQPHDGKSWFVQNLRQIS